MGANLAPASLKSAQLSGVNLREANLSGANLEGAVVHTSSLVAADPTDASLRNTGITLEDLEGRKFSRAIIDGAIVDS